MSQQVPGRIFLDTSVLQTLQDFGEFIYDGGIIDAKSRIRSIPDGVENVVALRKIMLIGARGSLQFALSKNSLAEVYDRGKVDFLQWAMEMVNYWNHQIAVYEKENDAFSGYGETTADKFYKDKRFGYLSKKDAVLLHDALLLECDVFLTMERRLPKNGSHIERELGIEVLQPLGYWSRLLPWAALLG